MQSCVWFNNLLFEDLSSDSNNFFQAGKFAIVFTVLGKLKFSCQLEFHNSYKKTPHGHNACKYVQTKPCSYSSSTISLLGFLQSVQCSENNIPYVPR